MKTLHLFGNWKMYLTPLESTKLAELLVEKRSELPSSVHCAVFPTALALKDIAAILKDTLVAVGVQNCAEIEHGAYTGEVSPLDCAQIGARYALIGHSERRHVFHETDHEIHRKLKAAVTAGLVPVVCVGETRSEREALRTDDVVLGQVRAAVEGMAWGADKSLFIAYEPVWAINSGEACSPDEAQRVAGIIIQEIKKMGITIPVKILYGGSVTAQNIQKYVESPTCDGVLVGSASVKAHSWFELVNALRA